MFSCAIRHLTSIWNSTSDVNPLCTDKSRSLLIQLKQHRLYTYDPKTKTFTEVSDTFATDLKVTLVFFSNSDSTIRYSTKEIETLSKLAGSLVVVCRWSAPEQLKRMIAKTKAMLERDSSEGVEMREIGSSEKEKKIDKLVFLGHGSPEGIQGGRPLAGLFAPTYFNSDTLDAKDLAHLAPGAEIVLASCSTGAAGGLAQQLSGKVDDREVRAATEAITKITVDAKNVIHLMDGEHHSDPTVVYHKGEYLSSENSLDRKLFALEKKLNEGTLNPEELKELKTELKEIRKTNRLQSIRNRAPAILFFTFLLVFAIATGNPIFIGIALFLLAFTAYHSVIGFHSGVKNKLNHLDQIAENLASQKNLTSSS